MVNVVFECDLDDGLIENIDNLRTLRLEALKKQLLDIDSTLDFLESQRAISSEDRKKYKLSVEHDLQLKIDITENRISRKDTIYSDELELYLELLAEPAV